MNTGSNVVRGNPRGVHLFKLGGDGGLTADDVVPHYTDVRYIKRKHH